MNTMTTVGRVMLIAMPERLNASSLSLVLLTSNITITSNNTTTKYLEGQIEEVHQNLFAYIVFVGLV